jgi:DNA-binding transcriptional ArsR family regulator
VVDAREALEILSENSRWRIIQILIREALCGKALAARLSLSRSAVSQHLSELRRAGLIQEKKDGHFTFCCVQRERLDQVVKLVIALLEYKADPLLCSVQGEIMEDKKVKRENYLPMCDSCVGAVEACANVGGGKPP